MKRSFLIIPLFCAVSVYAADLIYVYNLKPIKVNFNNAPVSDCDGDLHNGFDENGYDENGFDINGIHRDTGTIYDPEGFNVNGLDKNGYDRNGFPQNGCLWLF